MNTFEISKLVPIATVIEILDSSRASVYRRLKNDPTFPRPIRFPGGRSVRWELTEILRYVAAAAANREVGNV